jgi:hypothetical protein
LRSSKILSDGFVSFPQHAGSLVDALSDVGTSKIRKCSRYPDCVFRNARLARGLDDANLGQVDPTANVIV